MEDYSDMSKYKAEAKIYSIDRKYEKVFTDEDFLKAINECEHLFSIKHITKDVLIETEQKLSPLKPYAKKLMLETKGGSVSSTMLLEDFFLLLELGKRIEISDRFLEKKPQQVNSSVLVDAEIKDILNFFK